LTLTLREAQFCAQHKIRLALQNEPALRQGGMVDDRMGNFIRAAMQSLRSDSANQPAP